MAIGVKGYNRLLVEIILGGVMVSTQERCYDMYTGRDTCVQKKRFQKVDFSQAFDAL